MMSVFTDGVCTASLCNRNNSTSQHIPPLWTSVEVTHPPFEYRSRGPVPPCPRNRPRRPPRLRRPRRRTGSRKYGSSSRGHPRAHRRARASPARSTDMRTTYRWRHHRLCHTSSSAKAVDPDGTSLLRRCCRPFPLINSPNGRPLLQPRHPVHCPLLRHHATPSTTGR